MDPIPNRPAGPNLLDLPAEIFQWTVNKMKRKDRAALLQVCRRTYELTAPALYRRTYTKRGTQNDITALPAFFHARPNLIQLVRVFVIDEYDAAAMRRLLAIEFPNLESILMQHDDEVSKEISDDEKDSLNSLLVPQPKLENLTFSIDRKNTTTPYPLTTSDIPLFTHPSLNRLRLSYLDLACWADLPRETFHHPDLNILNIECCIMSVSLLGLLVNASTNLTQLRLDVNPFPEDLSHLSTALQSCRGTLKVLKLYAPQSASTTHALDFRPFTSLVHLFIRPSILLGPAYIAARRAFMAPSNPDPPEMFKFPHPTILRLLHGCLPRNLILLSLDDLISKNLPVPPQDLGYGLHPLDVLLVESILRNWRDLCPDFFGIYMFYCEHMAESDLFDLADRCGVKLVTMYNTMQDVTGPPVEIIEQTRRREVVEGEGEGELDAEAEQKKRQAARTNVKWGYI